MTAAVTAGAGVVCLILAVLIATIGRMQWPRTTVALVLTGATGILNSTIGHMIHKWVTQTDHWSGQFIGRWTGTAIFGVLGIITLAYAGFRIYQDHIDNRTLFATAAVPPTVVLIPGMLGTVATTIVGIVPATVGYIISLAWFGMR
jgi:hypothetical protein